MNYLAHSVLADFGDDVLLGSLLGDAWRGRPERLENVAVRCGLMLHRRLDVFTDAHPCFARSRARLRPQYRRYAGILVDVFYDHFLARDWPVFRADSSVAFAQRVYQLTLDKEAQLPEKLRRFARYMRKHQLLTGYARREVIGQVLGGLSQRLSRANPIADALDELIRNETGLREDFYRFFPHATHEARALIRRIRREQSTSQASANSQPVQA